MNHIDIWPMSLSIDGLAFKLHLLMIVSSGHIAIRLVSKHLSYSIICNKNKKVLETDPGGAPVVFFGDFILMYCHRSFN